MDTVALVALFTTVFSIFVKVVGMPDQIKSNYVRKSTDGLSNWFIVSTLISYSLWVVHGLQVHDMSLVIGQGLGVIVTGIIVWQMVMYRKNKSAGMKKTSTPSNGTKRLIAKFKWILGGE